MSVLDRMEVAIRDLRVKHGDRRLPKAFYLTDDDFDAFMATAHEMVTVPFGNNPTTERTDPAFCGIPVRRGTGRFSAMCDTTTTRTPLPTVPLRPDIPWQDCPKLSCRQVQRCVDPTRDVCPANR